MVPFSNEDALVSTDKFAHQGSWIWSQIKPPIARTDRLDLVFAALTWRFYRQSSTDKLVVVRFL